MSKNHYTACTKFLCSYHHDEQEWSLEIWAYDWADAEARVAKLGFLRLDGEIKAEIPARVGFIAKTVCWFKNILLAILLTLPLNAQPLVDRIQPFEDATKNPAIVGDKGKSRGMYMIGEAAWCEVTAIRQRQGLRTADWETGAHGPLAREYAKGYLKILRHDLTRALNRAPSNAELYSAYTHGVNGFRRAGFDLNRTAKHIQRKAKNL